jgi:mRNA-degrading endonuclease YafQ of YafQ-DinJ toxin-antitoxin module
MPEYKINILPLFDRRCKKLFKKNLQLRQSVIKTLLKLMGDPFQKSLKTHKVDSKVLKNVYSSHVNGDIRIIWSFNKKKVRILDIHDIGGHEGSHKVYN